MQAERNYDAIVVGSGVSGGWAAKELCEKGLKTLVLERGRPLEHITGYETANMAPWEFEHRGTPSRKDREIHHVQSRIYAYNEGTKHMWINDLENPYTTPEGKEFRWIRGDHVGGKSLMWHRHVPRWSNMDFEANLKDGHGVDWPLRYPDIAPWYDYVERFIGVSGSEEGLDQLPDGQFLPPFEMSCIEKHIKEKIEAGWKDRKMIPGRMANLSRSHQGRNKCMNRNLCARGCPFGGYFSSQSSTLPAAEASGNLTLRPHSMVESVLYDHQKDRVTGVRVIDAQNGNLIEYTSKIVFLCAGTLATTHILLNSSNSRFPDGLANSSGELGRNLMDHHGNVGAYAIFEGFEKSYHSPGGPQLINVPRFRNIHESHPDFMRGYHFTGAGRRINWKMGANNGIGTQLKESLIHPGPWGFMLYGEGECLPNPKNRVTLNHDMKDKFGLPVLHIDMEFGENEINMRKDMKASAVEMLEASGASKVYEIDYGMVPGGDVHEMGTSRMGHDPASSVLNKWNQCHDIPNLFITDGSFMTSSACQNPSLTYMAFTARAVDYCVSEMKKGNLR